MTRASTTYRPLHLTELVDFRDWKRGADGKPLPQVFGGGITIRVRASDISVDPRLVVRVEPFGSSGQKSESDDVGAKTIPAVFLHRKGGDAIVARGDVREITLAWEAALRGDPITPSEWGYVPAATHGT